MVKMAGGSIKFLFYFVKKLSRRRPGFADTLLHEYWNISVKEKNFVYDLLLLLTVYLCKNTI